MKTARVVIDKATHSYDKEYDYILPEGSNARAGCRILVPFGAGGGRRVGFVVSVFDATQPPAPRMKQIASVLDE